MLGRDVVDQLEHRDGLADAGAAEQTDLAALGERAHQIDDLDAGFEQLDRWRQLVELRRLLMNSAPLVRLNRAALVDRTTQHVHHAPEHAGTDWNHDVVAGVGDRHAAPQSVRRTHRDRAHDAVTQLLLDLERQTLLDQFVGLVLIERQRVVDMRHLIAREFDIDDSANTLNNSSLTIDSCRRSRSDPAP